MKLSLQKCKIEDLAELIKVSRSTFIDAFEHLNNPEDFQRYLAKAFHQDQMLSELTNPNSTFYFMYADEQLAGYLKINENEAQKEHFDMQAMELERIYMKNGFQGKGLGTQAIALVKSLAEKKNKSYLWLGVWEQNTDAIKFYNRLGFQKFGQHPYLIGEDEQYDWLLKLDLI